MCKNYNELEFTHFVVDNSDGTVFGCARINGSGKIANFLIKNEDIKQRSGDAWQPIDSRAADIVRTKATTAYGRVRIYRTTGIF